MRTTVITLLLFCSCILFGQEKFHEWQNHVVILPGDYADPSVLKDGDDYYMTHSPFYYQPGFLIWHSKDLINWTPVCRAGSSWNGSAWAPDLQKVGDTYYIYFPANETNYVVWTKDIRGPWSEPIDLKIGGIDPGLAVTPDGERYLFTNGGNVTPLTRDGLSRSGETRHVYEGWKYPQEWETECMCLESPKITYRNGYYYMVSAEGGTAGPATSHMAVCARSKSIDGPWENSPYNPIVHTYSADERWWSKGHGTIVEGPDHQWYIVYHAYDKQSYALGRQTLMEPIEWTENGWFRPVKDKLTPQPEFAANSVKDISDDFSASALGWQWTAWKENANEVTSLNNGALSIPAKGTTPQDGRLLLVTATDNSYVVEATVGSNDNNVSTGLILFYKEDAFAGVTCNKSGITVYKSSNEKKEFPNKAGKTTHLRLENRLGKLSVLVSSDGKQWKAIAADIDITGLHHNKLGDFLALRPALCSMGKGQAKVYNFSYTPLEGKNIRSLYTENLLSSLKKIETQGTFMFGHHDDTAYGVGWVGDSARSDVKSVCGDYPALMGFDLGRLELGSPKNLDGVEADRIRQDIIKQFERGGVTSLSWHCYNPLSGRQSWVEDSFLNIESQTVASILTEGETHDKFITWLDRVANFINSLETADGVKVPVIFRPWHEHTGSWFWWGQKNCTTEDFKALWRLTVNRLRQRGVVNALYAYSTGTEADGIPEKFMERYPGDEYIDLIGLDFYCSSPVSEEDACAQYIQKADKHVSMLCQIAKNHGKAAAVTETGYEGIKTSDWWTRTLLPAIAKHPVCYILVWRNAHDKKGHFYAPYPGHPSAQDFVKFHKDKRTLFTRDLNGLYQIQ